MSKVPLKLPALISYGDKVYRPAGYRIPEAGEVYVGKNGHVKVCLATVALRPAAQMLILREYDADKDFK